MLKGYNLPLGNTIRNLLKTKAGRTTTRLHLLMHSSIEQQYPKDTHFNEVSYRDEFYKKAMRFIEFNKINGDYLEFGCYGSVTFTLAHKYKHMNNLQMKLYAFDSFQGLPPPSGIDSHDQWNKGDYKMGMQDFITSSCKASTMNH
jgi:hypothetical protein